MRATAFEKTPGPPAAGKRPFDFATTGFILVLLIIGGWTAAMPISRSVQDKALERFHLASRSFTEWAMLQSVPAMYNFANHYCWSSRPRGCETSGPAIVPQEWRVEETAAVNHFPVRLVTFADNRVRLLRGAEEYRLVVRSEYRGRSMTSCFEVRAGGEGSYVLRRHLSTLEGD